jgi:predicted RND superfamily exporter protein
VRRPAADWRRTPNREIAVPRRLILALHDRLAGRDRHVLVVAALLALAALAGTTRLSLDMSFRPLFAHSEEDAAATAAFEARFGQSSGAHAAVLLERDAPLDATYGGELERLAAQLRTIEGVAEVQSPVRAPAPVTSPTSATGPLLEPGLVRDEGRLVLLLVRMTPPLDALHERRAIIADVRAATRAWLRPDVRAHYTGVSVVEEAYASAVPRGMALSLVLTSAAVVALLFGLFGHPAAVAAALAGVTVAAPLTLALYALTGRPLTMLGTMAPTIILVVGAADAVHMIRRWQLELAVRERGAVRRTIAAMALPCTLTALTTALGFASLSVARIGAIREFGLLVALGVILVFAANLVLLPALLRRYGARIPVPLGDVSRPLLALGTLLTRRPAAVAAAALLFAAAAAIGVPRLSIDQRFNEELRRTHPVRAAQQLMEREFGGFLGPDLEVTRVDGGSVVAPDALAALRRVRSDIAALTGVDGVSSVLDIVPAGAGVDARAALDALRNDPALGTAVRERIHTSERTALHVRTGDLGTAAALELADDITRLASTRLGDDYDVRVVGQWWLAQLGTSSLLRDMLISFATSALLVLPLLAWGLRSRRLLLIALPPNLLPMVAALAWMGWTGTSLRVGTALVLAVALAIAIDDTIHLLTRAEESRRRGASPRTAMLRAMTDTGPALVATTLVLVAGFLSMITNPLAAIRDMGVVASAALGAALLGDLLLLPALYTLLHRPAPALRHRRAAATSSVASSERRGRGRLLSYGAPVGLG